MATGNDIIKEAKKYVDKGGSTFWKAYGVGAVDWCCIFVWYVMKQCGASDLFYDGQKTAWVPSAQEWMAKHGKKVALKDAKPGDIVIFTWNGSSRDHIGFAIKPINSTTLQTIEGNTLSDDCTTSKVAIRERPKKYIYGIYRPKYSEEKKVAKKTYGEIRKYRCVAPAHVYKDHAVKSGRNGAKDTVVGSVYSAVAWEGDWIKLPVRDDGWVPTKGSKGLNGEYFERVTRITYVVTNISGINIYADHTTASKHIENVKRGSYLTATRWFGGWAYFPSVKGWGAVSCLTEKNGGSQLYREMEIIAQTLRKRNITYSIDNLKLTLDAALADGRIDCAHYVSFGLQAMGVLTKGNYIWLNTKINGNGASQIKASKKVKISYPKKSAKEMTLRIGDICGYCYKGGQHTHVFAGYDKAGNPYWFSAGISDVNKKSYGPKRKTTYEDRPISVLIRVI